MNKTLNKSQISTAIIGLARRELKKPINSNSINASLVLELGADSLDIVELIMAIEKEFAINFPDSANKNLNTVEDIINITINLLEKSN